jgi:hypothetical protein
LHGYNSSEIGLVQKHFPKKIELTNIIRFLKPQTLHTLSIESIDEVTEKLKFMTLLPLEEVNMIP